MTVEEFVSQCVKETFEENHLDGNENSYDVETGWFGSPGSSIPSLKVVITDSYWDEERAYKLFSAPGEIFCVQYNRSLIVFEKSEADKVIEMIRESLKEKTDESISEGNV